MKKLINLSYGLNTAILTDDDIDLSSPFVSCVGFMTSPAAARNAAVKQQIETCFASDKKKFNIPVSSIVFVEYMNERG